MFDTLLKDVEVECLLGDAALARAMVEVERALARVQGRLGLIDGTAAARIDQGLAGFTADLEDMARGVRGSAVPVPALLRQLRDELDPELRPLLHLGATSQDIVDTALVLQLSAVLELIAGRIRATLQALIDIAEAHGQTVMLARTRFQPALPTTFGLKVAGWLLPLARHLERLAELRPRLLVIQFGGAAGTLAPLGERGPAVMDALAHELGLASPPMPWHTQRDGPLELAAWLAQVAGSLGKLGTDVLLMAQGEVGELREAAGGGSSTLPQKANPIRAEALVTLARRAGIELGAMAGALVAAHERDGTTWQGEWLSLPGLASTTGAALDHALTLVRTLVIDPARMRANLDATRGLVLAEAAGLALARHLPLAEAQALVKDACRDAAGQDRHLIDLLRERTNLPIDWAALADPINHLGAAVAFQSRALAFARSALTVQDNG